MSTTRILIQARTDSARLPAKALLPVAGMPSALLALLRAGNTGLDVRLATSNRKVDDRLADVVEAAGLPLYRGSADDVRQRFLDACAALDDAATIVRLTADNLLPDGKLIETVLEAFAEQQASYLNLDMMWRRPPYGLSVEVFRLGALREAARQFESSAEREHVTPALRLEHEGCVEAVARFSASESAIRCTMDSFDDYQCIADCFNGIDDPVQASWQAVLDRLVQHPEAPMAYAEGPGLILGTAQIGAPYGSVVTVQPPGHSEAVRMIRTAISNGVTGIDTARAYPGSESIIGQALKSGYAGRCQIITKIAPLEAVPVDASPVRAADAAEISLLRSLNALGDCKTDVLLHRAAHLTEWGGAVWSRLVDLQGEGVVGRIGVSVQTPKELELALAMPELGLVQMPCNLLDWRWRKAGLTERLQQAHHVTVHVRSVLLQGTLARSASDWPNIENLDAQTIIDLLNQQTEHYERHSIADLCIAWMRAQPWVDDLVIGAETMEQLQDTLKLFSYQPLSQSQADELTQAIPEVPEQLLNPAEWK